MKREDGITLSAREIRDSRNTPTLEVTLELGSYVGTASVPSGKSRGSREARELRDADGVGVQNALTRLHGEVAELLRSIPLDPLRIDAELKLLDGTEHYERIGANVSLAVSFAARRLAAAAHHVPLWHYIAGESGAPRPTLPALYMNVINGGAHAEGSLLPFQEHIIVDIDRPSVAYMRLSRIFESLGPYIAALGPQPTYGDEGGYVSAALADEVSALSLLKERISAHPSCSLGVDVAATNFYDPNSGLYTYGAEHISTAELLERHMALFSLGVLSFEDPFEENDREHARLLRERFGDRARIVADDMAVTQKREVEHLITEGAANAMIVKPNQVGTLKEAYESVALAREHGWHIIASHRSGETEDSFIADFAVGIGAHGLKAGAPSQAVRRAKYERLCEIEKEMQL